MNRARNLPFFITGLFVFFGSVVTVQATALFYPGETLDPNCLPTNSDCTVSTIWTASSSNAYFNTGNVGIGTTSLVHKLTIDGNTKIQGTIFTDILSVSDTAAARSNLGLTYANNGDISTSSVTIATWGDSLTQGTGGTPYPTQLTTLTGYATYNGGIGGQDSIQIKDRMLAATTKYSWPTIIWVGRVNVTATDQTKADIAEMVGALGHQNYLVIGITNGERTDEHLGEPIYDQIVQLNNDLAATYGDHFIDIRPYLVSLYDINIAQDVIDYANDIPPSSLRSDAVHFNTTGYLRIAEKIQEKMDILIDLNALPKKIITTENLGYIFSNPSIIGATTPARGYFSNLKIGTSVSSTDSSATGAGLEISGGSLAGVLNNNIAISSGLNTGNLIVDAGTGNISSVFTRVNDDVMELSAGSSPGYVTGIGLAPRSAVGSSSDAITFFTRSVERVRINNSGNVGIGTTTPSYKLTVVGSSLVSATSTVGGNLSLTNISSAGSGIIADNGSNVQLFSFLRQNTVTSADVSISAFGGIGLTGGRTSNNPALGAYSLYVSTGGNVGIGTTSPGSKLEVYTASNEGTLIGNQSTQLASLGLSSVTSGVLFRRGSDGGGANGIFSFNDVGGIPDLGLRSRNDMAFFNNTTQTLTVKASGNVGIGTTSPTQKLVVSGSIQSTDLLGGITTLSADANGNIIRTPSDQALKENIVSLSPVDSLNKLLQLRGVSYDWKDKERFGSAPQIGFIAQEVGSIVPEVVTSGGDYKSLNYGNLTAIIVEAIKALNDKIDGKTVVSITESAPSGTVSSEAETSTLNGIQMADQATGQTYCVTIRNGEFSKSLGDCGSTSTPAPVAAPVESVPDTASSTATTTATTE